MLPLALRSFALILLGCSAFAMAAKPEEEAAIAAAKTLAGNCGSGVLAEGTVAHVTTPDDARLWMFSFNANQHAVFAFTEPQINALMAAFDITNYNARQAFAEAAWQWPQTQDMGFSSAYRIAEWVVRTQRYEQHKEEIDEDLAKLKPFVAKPAQGKAALDAYVAEIRSGLEKFRRQIITRGSLGRWDHREVSNLYRSFATLVFVTFRTRSLDARKAVEDLQYDWARYNAVAAISDQLRSLEHRPHEGGFDPVLIRRIANDMTFTDDLVDYLKANASPDRRLLAVRAILRSNAHFDGQRWHSTADDARRLAKRLAPEMFAASMPQVTGGCMPLVDTLLPMGGRRIALTLQNGDQFAGTVFSVADWDANVEGSAPTLSLLSDTDGKLLSLDLSQATSITVDTDRKIYDVAVNGPIERRRFLDLDNFDRQRLSLLDENHYGMVDDHSMTIDRVLKVARKLVAIGEPIPRTAEPLFRAFVALDEATADAEDETGLRLLRSMAAQRLVAAYALDLSMKDVGKAYRDRLRYIVVGLYLGRGGKAWAFDLKTLIRSNAGATALVTQLTLAAERDYPEYDLLYSSDPATANVFMAHMREKGDAENQKDIANRFRALDVRWKSAVEAILRGDVPKTVVFLPEAEAMLTQQTHRFLASLLHPDSFPFSDGRDAAALKFFADDVLPVVGAIGRKDQPLLLQELERIATAKIRTGGRSGELEKKIRAAAAALKASIEAAPKLPWEAMNLPSSK